ncbi:MAG: hypothetical protein WCO45_16345 [Pseudanabaena sp. ELA607]
METRPDSPEKNKKKLGQSSLVFSICVGAFTTALFTFNLSANARSNIGSDSPPQTTTNNQLQPQNTERQLVSTTPVGQLQPDRNSGGNEIATPEEDAIILIEASIGEDILGIDLDPTTTLPQSNIPQQQQSTTTLPQSNKEETTTSPELERRRGGLHPAIDLE